MSKYDPMQYINTDTHEVALSCEGGGQYKDVHLDYGNSHSWS